jgi:ribonuclease P/MRP protein subunit POP1
MEIIFNTTNTPVFLQFKIPCFPYDYPDSKACASFMAKRAAVTEKIFESRPAAKRPPKVHVPPLWQCIMGCFGKVGGIFRGLEVDGIMWSVTSESGGEEPLQESFVPSLQLHVPRTTQTLREYVQELDTKYLSSSSGMEMDTERCNLVSNGTVKAVCSLNELCLTRVLIRAFKEGSFEDGAVVCAPFLSDLSAWKIRSVNPNVAS